jgi:hypothetical protein
MKGQAQKWGAQFLLRSALAKLETKYFNAKLCSILPSRESIFFSPPQNSFFFFLLLFKTN